ncbi:MAG: hypothetical protein KKG04_00120 [Candidatus Thermoplasmatota archaeon]|nr:hypothetical protein [Candidatus Thermoplasmatota archaeon]
MEATPIDIVAFGPLAPMLGVLLFWFIQLLFIESQKYLLQKIKKRHEPFCRFTNFIGIFFQSICHALGYTVTRSGIGEFRLTTDYGTVAPRRKKEGVFEWISNSFLFIGPFFIPPLLLLLFALLLIPPGIPLKEIFTIESLTFGQQLIGFGENLFSFSTSFFSLIITLDLFHPAHLGFLILLIFLGLGIRPSYIIKQKTFKVDMVYDLNNIKNHILQHPFYLISVFIGIYLFYYLSVILLANWYLSLFSLFGWLSIIAISALLLAHLIILLISYTDAIKHPWRILPYIMLPLSYITSRIILIFFPVEPINTIALAAMSITTLVITLLLHRRRTNNFKTKTKMKPMRVEDGPRRIIEQ